MKSMINYEYHLYTPLCFYIVLLFGDYIWSRGVELKKNMVKVKDWQEVLEYFNAKAG